MSNEFVSGEGAAGPPAAKLPTMVVWRHARRDGVFERSPDGKDALVDRGQRVLAGGPGLLRRHRRRACGGAGEGRVSR